MHRHVRSLLWMGNDCLRLAAHRKRVRGASQARMPKVSRGVAALAEGPVSERPSMFDLNLPCDDCGKNLAQVHTCMTCCENGRAAHEALVEALEGILRITDRKHVAWDKARAALELARGKT